MSIVDLVERKLLTVAIFLDLFKMQTKLPFNDKKVVKLQNKRVRKLAKKAYKVPFYKERFDSVHLTPGDIRSAEDLAKLPLLTKEELRLWMKEEEKKQKYKYWYRDTTSGSTGNPLMLLVSPREKAYNMANWFRVMLLCGYNPFFGKTMSPVATHSKSGEKTTILQKFGILRREFLDNSASEEELIRHINTYKPDFLYTNKSTLMKLALYCKKNNVQIHQPKFFCPTGERIDDKARKLFCEVFGNHLIDSYGTAETGAVLTKFGKNQPYIANSDSFVIHVYDENNELSNEGRIIITPLYFTDLPIINYVIGDKVKTEEIDGRTYVTEIQGRMNDFFKHRNGRTTSYFEINKFIGECEEVTDIRFIQKSYELIHIQCVKNADIKNISTEEIEKRLSFALNQRLKEPMKLEFEWMNSIPSDKNGKLRVIICEI